MGTRHKQQSRLKYIIQLTTGSAGGRTRAGHLPLTLCKCQSTDECSVV